MTTAGTEYLSMLNSICKRIQETENFEEILWELEQDILNFLHAQRLTIYHVEPSGDRLVSWYKSDNDIDEIRLPIDASSISGYVALTGSPLRIDNVYDLEELRTIHPDLGFDSSFDESTGSLTESMICVPIKYKDQMLGVLQVMNRLDGSYFTDENVIHTLAIANLMGQRMRVAMRTSTGPFQHLVETRKVTLDELLAIEEEMHGDAFRIIRHLIKKKSVTKDEIGEALEHYFQVPFMQYDEELEPKQDLLLRLDRSYLARNFWCPFEGEVGELIILIDDPTDNDRIFEIQQLCGQQHLDIRVGTQEDILRFLGYHIEEDEQKETNLAELVGKLASDVELVGDDEITDELDENASVVVQLVNKLIMQAVALKASDIHVEPSKGAQAATVRVRIDGALQDLLEIPATHIRPVTARIKVLSRLDIAERRKPQDGKMTLKLYGNPVELRIATIPTVNGESVVMRILASAGGLPYDKLNLSPKVYDGCKRLIAKPYGIFLVVGPTGSGKTTTLHAVLGVLNTRERKIVTAEDPVEITQPGLQQVQVQARIGLTFATALRAFLRADPNVILIGEMRDYETAHTGMEASLTGHMVFSTLHTNSAPETVVRLLEMGLDPLNFADALVGVLAQRLARTLCPNCKEKYEPEQAQLELMVQSYGTEYIGELINSSNEPNFCRPVGCDKCQGKGWKGRTGIHELLEATSAMKQLIARKADVHNIRVQAMKDGMRTLRQDGIQKVFRGDTSFEQITKITVD